MSTLDVNPTYSSDTLLNASDLDTLVDPLETFFNVTKLDENNINVDSVAENFTSVNTNSLITKANSTGADSIINNVSSDIASGFVSSAFQLEVSEINISESTDFSNEFANTDNRIVLDDGNSGGSTQDYGVVAPATSSLTITSQIIESGFYLCSVNGMIAGFSSISGSATVAGRLEMENCNFSNLRDNIYVYNETFTTTSLPPQIGGGFLGGRTRRFNETFFINLGSQTTLNLILRLTSASPSSGNLSVYESVGISANPSVGVGLEVKDVELRFTKIRDFIS